MNDSNASPVKLPSENDLRQAVKIYLNKAYSQDPPEDTSRFLPPAGANIAAWLEDVAEPEPKNVPIDEVRSLALRIGNEVYPHMKLRLSRPPRENFFIFLVDAHDAFLHADPDSPDYAALEELKAHNAKLAGEIQSEWARAGLPTEHNYLREKIR